MHARSVDIKCQRGCLVVVDSVTMVTAKSFHCPCGTTSCGSVLLAEPPLTEAPLWVRSIAKKKVAVTTLMHDGKFFILILRACRYCCRSSFASNVCCCICDVNRMCVNVGKWSKTSGSLCCVTISCQIKSFAMLTHMSVLSVHHRPQFIAGGGVSI